MSHDVVISLIKFAYYFAILIWCILLLLILFGIIKKKWDLVKRIGKYLVNSVVFFIAYAFYLEVALLVKPPVSEPLLKSWINDRVLYNLLVSIIVAIILFAINYGFYKKVESRKYKVDLYILTIFDIVVLLVGAWLAGQDAYYGFLEELNRR
jgi:asparagine N-glycosylation enzyme membrane subunit Stt3